MEVVATTFRRTSESGPATWPGPFLIHPWRRCRLRRSQQLTRHSRCWAAVGGSPRGRPGPRAQPMVTICAVAIIREPIFARCSSRSKPLPRPTPSRWSPTSSPPWSGRAVSFLIADFSGRALVRFGTPSPGVPDARRQGSEQAETVPLAGTVYDRVLRTQQVDVQELADGAHLTVSP